jgi:hypothetical protein
MRTIIMRALPGLAVGSVFGRLAIAGGPRKATKGTISLWRAFWWVAAAHGNQRYGRFPYWYHLVQVMLVALSAGITDKNTLLACLAHDVLEDTSKTRRDMLEAGFPLEVVLICEALKNIKTGEPFCDKVKTYCQIFLSGWKTILVKVCDRTANGEYGLAFGLFDGDHQYESYRKIYPLFRAILWDAKQVECDPAARRLWARLDKVMRFAPEMTVVASGQEDTPKA